MVPVTPLVMSPEVPGSGQGRAAEGQPPFSVAPRSQRPVAAQNLGGRTGSCALMTHLFLTHLLLSRFGRRTGVIFLYAAGYTPSTFTRSATSPRCRSALRAASSSPRRMST